VRGIARSIEIVTEVASGGLEVGKYIGWCAVRSHVPLPFDHFFFCFLPPVAAGAFYTVSGLFPPSDWVSLVATYHFVGCVVVLKDSPVAERISSRCGCGDGATRLLVSGAASTWFGDSPCQALIHYSRPHKDAFALL
jgi:hypothetical protein